MRRYSVVSSVEPLLNKLVEAAKVKMVGLPTHVISCNTVGS